IVLIIAYGGSLIYAFRTNEDPFRPVEDTHKRAHLTVSQAMIVLGIGTALTGVQAELLVERLEPALAMLGLTELFVGVIVVAIIGNAAEHSTAIIMASKNKMDGAINIAVGSSIQVALFVAPLLLFLSYFIAPRPMDLIFTSFEVLAVGVCVGIMALSAADGESHWMEGVQLLAVYIILGIAFYFLPVAPGMAGH
ncbi:MAG TPA: cation transporter, partial [Longimicrobium sp.]|nr:cation transporter [Longimicrobium sp.]